MTEQRALTEAEIEAILARADGTELAHTGGAGRLIFVGTQEIGLAITADAADDIVGALNAVPRLAADLRRAREALRAIDSDVDVWLSDAAQAAIHAALGEEPADDGA